MKCVRGAGTGCIPCTYLPHVSTLIITTMIMITIMIMISTKIIIDFISSTYSVTTLTKDT